MLVFDYYDYPHVSDRRPERPKSHQPRATPWVNVVRSQRPVGAKAFGLTGRFHSPACTQGAALGYELFGLSGRHCEAGEQ